MFPGPQLLIMDWMKHKMQTKSNHKTLCSLALDEVQISKAIQYDPSLKQFVGFINEEFTTPTMGNTAASHVLCFMAKGITLHWKQLIGVIH